MSYQTPQSSIAESTGLLAALRILRERILVIVLCAAVAAVVAFFYVERQHNQYTATSALQFTNNSLPSQVAGVQANQTLDPEGEKATNVQLVTTKPVAELVAASLHNKWTAAELLDKVTATDAQNDYIVDVTATDEDPHAAAEIANAFAQQYVVYSQQQNQAQLIRGEELIAQKEARLAPTDTTDLENLRALYQKLLLLQSVQTGNANVVNTAAVPSTPSSPKRKQVLLIALIAGVLVGIGFAFLLNLIDRRVRSWEEFEKLYDLPLLTAIPQLPRGRAAARLPEVAVEPFLILRNSLSLIAESHEPNTVLITSAMPGEGKTTVALGLARAAALSGTNVVLVEADVRRPSLQRRLLLDYDPRGLLSVLLDGDDPRELLRQVPDEPPGLRVLTGGSSKGSAPNLAGVENLDGVFARLSLEADLVIVDSAPLLPVVDTRVLLDEVAIDVTLVIARAGITTRDQARRARAIFTQRDRKTVGLVVNDLADSRDYYYYGGDSGGAPVAPKRSAQSAPTPPERVPHAS
jgi:capsular polysaccharide biosynthesis protein